MGFVGREREGSVCLSLLSICLLREGSVYLPLSFVISDYILNIVRLLSTFVRGEGGAWIDNIYIHLTYRRTFKSLHALSNLCIYCMIIQHPYITATCSYCWCLIPARKCRPGRVHACLIPTPTPPYIRHRVPYAVKSRTFVKPITNGAPTSRLFWLTTALP